MPYLELETEVAAPIEACFHLALSVDAYAASMAEFGYRPVAGVTSGELLFTQQVTWQGRHLGLPIRRTVWIQEYESPTRFVEEEVKGPFAWWWHSHTFEALPSGGTRMVDKVEYWPPLGVLGAVLDLLGLTRHVRRVLERRNAWLELELARTQDSSREPRG